MRGRKGEGPHSPRKRKPTLQKRAALSLHQRRFLTAFGELGNVTAAASAAGVIRQQHYDWLADPKYAAAYQDAREQYADALETELRRRIFDGIEEPVIYQGKLCWQETASGKKLGKPLVVKKFSDVSLIAALNAKRPSEYRQNAKVEITGSIDLVGRLEAGRKRLAEGNGS